MITVQAKKVSEGGYATVIIDDEDRAIVAGRSLFFDRNKGKKNGYIKFVKNGKTVRLHREIIGASKGEIVDHINGDTLDNRRSNLRICSLQESCFNTSLRKNNSSGVRGVHMNSRSGRWYATIVKGGKSFFLGSFCSKDDAKSAYENAARELFGVFKRQQLSS